MEPVPIDHRHMGYFAKKLDVHTLAYKMVQPYIVAVVDVVRDSNIAPSVASANVHYTHTEASVVVVVVHNTHRTSVDRPVETVPS